MGSGSSVPKDVHIVIVGGGYGGSLLALKLQKAGAKYTVIDATDSFEHSIAAVRACAVEDYAKYLYVPYKESFGENFTKGTVVKVDPAAKTVHLDDEKTIAYDILVLATGSTTVNFPGKAGMNDRETARNLHGDCFNKVKSAQRICLIGGGPQGVEIAGEIATEMPEKNVTLVHSSEKLLTDELNNKFHKRLGEILSELNVKVILGDKVKNLNEIPDTGPVMLETEKGASIECDLVLKCVGTKINSGAYENGLNDNVNDRGQLKVTPTLQVEGHEDIFAMGDCTDLKEAKLAFLAKAHVPIVIENIKRLQEKRELVAYKLDSKPIVLGVSIGRRHGLAQLKNGFLLPEFFFKKVKSTDLLVKDTWKEFGQKVPS